TNKDIKNAYVGTTPVKAMYLGDTKVWPNTKIVEYTLSTDQGSPDVYVDDTFVGTATNGILTWKAPEYDKDVEISLLNYTVPSTKYIKDPHLYVDGQEMNQLSMSWNLPDGGGMLVEELKIKITCNVRIIEY